jgi:hypothetical protein
LQIANLVMPTPEKQARREKIDAHLDATTARLQQLASSKTAKR